jgi:hypothetical protein
MKKNFIRTDDYGPTIEEGTSPLLPIRLRYLFKLGSDYVVFTGDITVGAVRK